MFCLDLNSFNSSVGTYPSDNDDVPAVDSDSSPKNFVDDDV